MVLPRHRIAPSRIEGAGKGLFLDEPVAAGRVVVAPDAIDTVYRAAQIHAMPQPDAAWATAARWFEDFYTLSPDWPPECHLNHSFAPTGLWHLGFVFAAADLPAGTEVTVDYRHLLGENQREPYRDAPTGEEIIGWPWAESLRRSTQDLAALLRSTDAGATAARQ
ncbi:MAG TPA: SET domain-containing protein [Xanthomonadaceae bacterium]|nr:SET domain-containing protein [Xanthomonadaceae bacterium]